MPFLLGYGKKRRFIKRRRFVARRRHPVGIRNHTGAEDNPNRGFMRMLSGPTPFPTGMRRSHTFCELYQLTSGTGVFGTQQAMRLNSPYDPNYTGGGHQPYGFDTMITLYNQYRVDRVSFQLLFTTPGGSHDMLCAACVNPNTSQGLTGANLQYPIETPQCYFGPLSSSGERRCVLKGSLDCAKLMGVSKTRYVSNKDYSAFNSTNPTQDMLLTTAVGCYDGTTGETVQVQIIITYDVWWFDRQTLVAS